jgi:hypothetical protein
VSSGKKGEMREQKEDKHFKSFIEVQAEKAVIEK